ncbi:uncharacterized protein [Lolium perenne]|uniref:uncharacterized protein n=1 Tax=Lolium perenne TaxID=4522 RepID=UPI0021F5A068|nr:uncharacterized protein LOC127343174 [Lolium perenne]
MASAPEDKLADLPSAELVAYLSNSYLKADFEAVARILVARDSRNAKLGAELTAALADLDALAARGREATEVKAKLEAARTGIDALREKYRALLDAFLPPRNEVDEMALTMVEAAVSDTVHRDYSRVDDEEAEEGEVKGIDFIDLSSDEEEGEMAEGGSEEEDEEDTESLSQRIKRIRGDRPGELESGKLDARGQSNSVGTLGNDQQKSSSARIEGLVATSGKMASKPEDSKVEAFVQESPVVKTENFDQGMTKTMLLPSQGPLASSAIQEGSSKIDYCKAGIGGKGRSSDGAPARGVSQPSKGIAETNKTPAAQSSAKCGKKEVGAEKCASLSIPSEEPRITRDVVPFEPCKESNAYVQVKREMSSLPSEITSKWDCEAPVIDSLFDEEICMQGFCALYRQGKLATADKRDEFRANKLAEFLLGGDLQGPMKRTVEELKNQDATNVYFLQKLTLDCSEQVYGIFRNKEDPYFF